MQFQNALSNLLQYHRRQMPDVLGVFGCLRALEVLTTALLEDGRIFCLDGVVFHKLQLCYQLGHHQRSAIVPHLPPKRLS